MQVEGIRAWAAVAALGLVGAAAADDRVATKKGVVEGTMKVNGVRAFLGIPFAEPPVGELRWKAPRPAKAWDGVRPAKAFAPGPVQNPLVAAMTGAPPSFSEDCLYLNVWTPAKGPGDRLPVMVWIYGGAFMIGSTNVPAYEGSRLAEKGVVVVSVAYRVGPLGFLAHPELSREEGAGGVSGNYGLRDQIAGLEWVRDEIEAFGGDPGNVTIFGESAGGISVSMLAASPKAKGLFHRAISQSGGSFAPPKLADEGGQNGRPLKLAESEGVRFLDDLDVDDIAAARALPAPELNKRQRWWWPNYDGDVLPGDQYELYRAGQFNDTPVLIGTNSDEGAMFVQPGPTSTAQAFAATVRAGYGEHAEKLLDAYPHATDAEALRSARDLFRDAAFGWPTWAWANLQSEKGKNRAFVYYFDVRSPRSPDGATHAADIPYVFRHMNLLGGFFGKPRPEDLATSELMSDYWVQFAKTGDPNREGLPAWPAYTRADPRVMTFDAAPSPRAVPNLPKLEALDGYYAWRRGNASRPRAETPGATAPATVP